MKSVRNDVGAAKSMHRPPKRDHAKFVDPVKASAFASINIEGGRAWRGRIRCLPTVVL